MQLLWQLNQFPNTQITVGGTTVNDIGGNLILDGANLDTKHLTGTVGGDLIVKSRQDDYQYTHDQKQAGFSADVGFDGKPQSFSINGGKTDVDADYAQVTHQSGIKANQSTLSVQGQGKFTGGYLITDAGKNQTQFAQGIQTQDIENHLNYEGDAISVGIGIGADTSNPDGKAKPALQGIGYGTIDPVNKTSTTHAAITDQAGLSHINTDNFKQEEVQNQLNEIITNDFNKEQVLTELGAQVTITTEFDNERRAVRSEYAKKAEGYRKQAEELPQGSQERTELETKAKQIDDNLRLFDGITSALYAPNSNGIIGDVARAVSPELAYRIGQEFKRKDQEGSAQHLLAHAVLGAAVSYATGNDPTTGALSGAGSEAAAPALANYLYGTKDPSELTQEQKDTITSILNLATVTTAYTATDGGTADAVSAAEVGKVGVENNTLKKSDADELLRQIAYARRHYDGVKLDEEMRRIRSLAAKLAHDNFKEIQACQNNPTPSCVNKIKTEYKDVNFASLQDAYHKYQDTDKILSAYEFRNNSLVSCANTNFADCIIAADGTKVMQEAAYAAVGGAVAIGRGGRATTSYGGGNSIQNVSISPVRLRYDSSSKTWISPAGLNYGQGSKEGNRVKHVLEHASPNSSKPNHTVFNVQRNQILSLVDQAWAKRGNPLPSDPGVYIIPMGKVVGTHGETSIRIIVKPGTNQVITAYPVP